MHREINKAGLVDILGEIGQENVQEESVKKLDLYANDQFIAAFKSGGECAAVASEEDEDIIILDGLNSQNGKYLVSIDPLDGSSNIDVNISVGTIFSVLQRKDTNKTVTKDEFFVAGKEQVAAGYVIYGSSTMLVYTGNGVNGFTLDPSIGEFCLSHPNIQTPINGEIYSVNEANLNIMSKELKDMLFCQQLDDNKNAHILLVLWVH